MAPQVPSTPLPFFAVVHAWQMPVQAELQHTPSTQNPLGQSDGLTHAVALTGEMTRSAARASSQRCAPPAPASSLEFGAHPAAPHIVVSAVAQASIAVLRRPCFMDRLPAVDGILGSWGKTFRCLAHRLYSPDLRMQLRYRHRRVHTSHQRPSNAATLTRTNLTTIKQTP